MATQAPRAAKVRWPFRQPNGFSSFALLVVSQDAIPGLNKLDCRPIIDKLGQ